MMTVTNLLSRFDQCVIDRAPGMLDQLWEIQSKLYEAVSTVEKLFYEAHQQEVREKLATMAVMRIDALRRLRQGDKGAFDELLRMAQEIEMGELLSDVAASIDRGGRPVPKVVERIANALNANYQRDHSRSWQQLGIHTITTLKQEGDDEAADFLAEQQQVGYRTGNKVYFKGFVRSQVKRVSKKGV